jgi:HPt (histidine-containing phosphotransfer) domain-containing protein
MDAALLPRIDFFRLALNLGGNMHVIEEMLGLFLSTSMSQMEKLEHAERSLNILAWKQTTHQLKGAAQNITAKRFASLCIEAEEIHSLPHPQSGAVIYHLYKELALLRGAIEAHLQRHH